MSSRVQQLMRPLAAGEPRMQVAPTDVRPQGAGPPDTWSPGAGPPAAGSPGTGPPGVRAPGIGPTQADAPDVVGLTLSSVCHGYRDRSGATTAALRDVWLHADQGQVLAVLGPSGCGKSTLLELICGLQRPDAGSVAAPPAALMAQRDLLLPWLNALDNAALPLRIHGLSRAAARECARPLFAELGLAGFESARPAALSGGMRQRVAFLRTLLSGKPLLCLDEPFGALDAITRMQMQGWLAQALAQEMRTVVLVTHDVEEAVLLGDRVAVMSPRPGRVIAQIEIALDRPRSRTDEEITHLRERALQALGIEAMA